jgi:hypothetical protein
MTDISGLLPVLQASSRTRAPSARAEGLAHRGLSDAAAILHCGVVLPITGSCIPTAFSQSNVYAFGRHYIGGPLPAIAESSAGSSAQF